MIMLKILYGNLTYFRIKISYRGGGLDIKLESIKGIKNKKAPLRIP